MIKKKILFCMLFIAFFVFGARYSALALADEKWEGNPLASADDTIFGTPTLTPSEPTSFDDVLVSCPINDPDGIDNATLFWKYITVDNSTEYNTTMTGGETIVVDTLEFQRSGYITNTGVETTSQTTWRFGEFIYEEELGTIVSQIDATITAPGVSTILVYVLIQAKNLTTGLWEERYKVGQIGGTTIDLDPATYTSTELTIGYRIYAITYRPFNLPSVPAFNTLQISRLEFQATIPAIDEPTWVNYYIKAYDLLQNSVVSENYSFLMDSTPIVQINDLPTILANSDNFVLNVTVTDVDGITTVNDSSVKAYYKLETQSDWSVLALTHIVDISSTEAFYNASIPIADYGDLETTLYLSVNASDIVGTIIGKTGTTGVQQILIDGLYPQVDNIIIEGGVTVPDLENTVLVNANVSITADFNDPSGVEEIYIYYAIPNGTTFVKQRMTNLTLSDPNITPVTYNATLPAANETGYVEYFFETSDYLGNKGNTSSYFYFADGSGPILTALKVAPDIISELTAVDVLFNATDPSNLLQSVLWYKMSDDDWDNVVANQIDYDALIDYEETFTAQNLPGLIQDKSKTIVELEVKRGGKVDTASISIDILHENSVDIRIWLRGGNRLVLLYDRMPNNPSFTLTYDLFEFGFEEADFTDNPFMLEIEDFSLEFSGSVTAYSIDLAHHEIPLGYQFRAIIPAAIIDTDVEFCIELTDSIMNQENTSIYEYYADALTPTIAITPISSPLDLQGNYFIEVSANVTDKGGILDVELYYKFALEDDWTIVAMDFVSGDTYSSKLILDSQLGDVFFKVRAFDYVGHSVETNESQISFSNALYPIITVFNVLADPLDMNGKGIFTVYANITDNGIITLATLFYRFNSDEAWTQLTLEYDINAGYYFADIELSKKSGLLQFKVGATDDSNNTIETKVFEVNYINGEAIDPLWIIIPSSAAGAAVIGALILAVIKKRKR